jgi:RNase H-fold protein (predicted Holliday junction resolvase)
MNVTESKNFLGIDWGSSKVGISFAEAETRMAFSVGTFRNDEDLLRKIGEEISSREVGTVVIGIPSHVNREVVVYEGEKLGAELAKRYPVRIAYQNEMFTTKMAHANLKEQGIRHVARFDDAEAARIILGEWLDRKFPDDTTNESSSL